MIPEIGDAFIYTDTQIKNQFVIYNGTYMDEEILWHTFVCIGKPRQRNGNRVSFDMELSRMGRMF